MGRALPPLILTKSKRTATSFREAFPKTLIMNKPIMGLFIVTLNIYEVYLQNFGKHQIYFPNFGKHQLYFPNLSKIRFRQIFVTSVARSCFRYILLLMIAKTKSNMTHLQMLQRRRRSDVSEIYGYKCDICIEDLLLPRL